MMAWKQAGCDDRPGVALVLCLFLLTFVVTALSALTLLAATETVRSDHVAIDLDHELAVNSFIEVLPELMKTQGNRERRSAGDHNETVYSLAFGYSLVKCRMTENKSKMLIHTNATVPSLGSRLLSLARTNALPAEDVALRPIMESPETNHWPRLVWFDQLIVQREFEEVFRRRPIEGDEASSDHRSWSDLVTFWKAASATVVDLDLETRVGSSVQRCFAVVALAPGRIEVLYRGRP